MTHQNQAPGFREACPYVLAYVELEEGPRLLTNVVGCEPARGRASACPVRVEFARDATGEFPVPVFRPGMILDLHNHSIALRRRQGPRRELLPVDPAARGLALDGFVLTEHRQFDDESDYRALEDEFGLLILKASEVETDYGHVLVFGVNDDLLRGLRLRAASTCPLAHVLRESERCGALAVPCHPGRPNVGLFAHYEARGPVPGVRDRRDPERRQPRRRERALAGARPRATATAASAAATRTS